MIRAFTLMTVLCFSVLGADKPAEPIKVVNTWILPGMQFEGDGATWGHADSGERRAISKIRWNMLIDSIDGEKINATLIWYIEKKRNVNAMEGTLVHGNGFNMKFAKGPMLLGGSVNNQGEVTIELKNTVARREGKLTGVRTVQPPAPVTQATSVTPSAINPFSPKPPADTKDDQQLQ